MKKHQTEVKLATFLARFANEIRPEFSESAKKYWNDEGRLEALNDRLRHESEEEVLIDCVFEFDVWLTKKDGDI